MQNSKHKRFSAVAQAVLAFSFFLLHSAKAEIPEPDNVLYGIITLSNVAVTAARTDVLIEARRVFNGSLVVSYRMGTNQRLGNFFALEVRLESVTTIADTAGAQTSETIL